jgi:predicted nucleic acid-binding protein
VTPTIEIVSDANVALKWFHAEDEEEVPEALVLLDAHRARTAAISVLDLTGYEVGNALVRGRAKLDARQAMTIVQALGDICPILRPDANEWRDAGDLADHHGLTIYDAAYAAVAARRGASLVTLDRKLLDAGLGTKPSVLAARIQGDER